MKTLSKYLSACCLLFSCTAWAEDSVLPTHNAENRISSTFTPTLEPNANENSSITSSLTPDTPAEEDGDGVNPGDGYDGDTWGMSLNEILQKHPEIDNRVGERKSNLSFSEGVHTSYGETETIKYLIRIPQTKFIKKPFILGDTVEGKPFIWNYDNVPHEFQWIETSGEDGTRKQFYFYKDKLFLVYDEKENFSEENYENVVEKLKMKYKLVPDNYKDEENPFDERIKVLNFAKNKTTVALIKVGANLKLINYETAFIKKLHFDENSQKLKNDKQMSEERKQEFQSARSADWGEDFGDATEKFGLEIPEMGRRELNLGGFDMVCKWILGWPIEIDEVNKKITVMDADEPPPNFSAEVPPYFNVVNKNPFGRIIEFCFYKNKYCFSVLHIGKMHSWEYGRHLDKYLIDLKKYYRHVSTTKPLAFNSTNSAESYKNLIIENLEGPQTKVFFIRDGKSWEDYSVADILFVDSNFLKLFKRDWVAYKKDLKKSKLSVEKEKLNNELNLIK